MKVLFESAVPYPRGIHTHTHIRRYPISLPVDITGLLRLQGSSGDNMY